MGHALTGRGLRRGVVAGLVLAAMDGVPVARAQGALGGVVSLELQGDATVASDDPAREGFAVNPTVDADLVLRLSDTVRLRAGLVAETAFDQTSIDDRFFEDVQAGVETLFLAHEPDAFTLYAGKFNPPFGIAWDLAPGLYGTDFAEDYELTERIGFGGSVALGGAATGLHVLGASAFFLDTTVLSESLIERRGRARLSDGGASNTGDPASFTVTLDGADLPGLPGLAYHAAVSRQERGEGDVADELGYGVALYGDVVLGDDLVLEPLVEFVRQENDEAGPDDATYVTGALALNHGPWSLALTGTLRSIEVADGPDADDHLVQVSIGYWFRKGLVLQAGYKTTRESGIDFDVLGALLGYEVVF
jgi:hypothetical protein